MPAGGNRCSGAVAESAPEVPVPVRIHGKVPMRFNGTGTSGYGGNRNPKSTLIETFQILVRPSNWSNPMSVCVK